MNVASMAQRYGMSESQFGLCAAEALANLASRADYRIGQNVSQDLLAAFDSHRELVVRVERCIALSTAMCTDVHAALQLLRVPTTNEASNT